MFNTFMRRAAMMVALPALVAGASASPAMANGYPSDYYKKVVHVQICKVVKGHKDDRHGDNRGRHDKFRVHLATYGYVDDADVRVEDRYCKNVDLKFDEYHKTVIVKEYRIPDGYKFDKIVCYNDYGYYDSYDSCDFQKDWVKIVVINKVVKKHHHDYDD
jgi:hypothetical protein